jgi:exodeoxyribonuclease VII large subunit
VGALVSQVRGHIEHTYPDCWVEGEISNLRAAGSGHLYFTLKDDQSQLPVVLFRRQAQLLRFRPEAGLHVLVRGRVTVYEERGQLQLIAETLEAVGAGSLQFAFEQLKQKLQQEGLFDAERKRPLPGFPRCIGIITSPSGAVIRDFLNIAARRHAGLDVLLYPATVQGEQASAEVAAGIHYFNRERSVDAIVIARGGGSAEDLAPFNSELLARAISGSELPVVSAIGHETDFTIADFVADLRAPSPSAAAELLTALQHGVADRLGALGQRLVRACRYGIALAERRFATVSPDATFARLRGRLERAQQRVDECHFRLGAAWQRNLHVRSSTIQQLRNRLLRRSSLQGFAGRRERAGAATEALRRALLAHFERGRREAERSTARLLLQSPAHRGQRHRQTVEHLALRTARAVVTRLQFGAAARASLQARLAALSPLAVLDRGYSLTYDAAGVLLRNSAALAPGDRLATRLARGSATSTVTTTENPQ